MPKRGFKKIEKVVEKIKGRIKASKLTDMELSEIASFARDRIIGMVRSGKSPGTEQREGDWSLSKSSIKHREYLAKYNQTSDVFSPKRSNLNVTGELIDPTSFSITTNAQKQSVVIEHTDAMHSQYRGKKGQPIGKPVSYKEIAKWQGDMGRIYFAVGPKTKELLIKKIKQIYRRAIAEVLRKK